MTEHHPTYFEARNVYQRLADVLPLVDRLCFVAKGGEVVSVGRVVREALREMFRLQQAEGWHPIGTAPKSTVGRAVAGSRFYPRYVLGWCPDCDEDIPQHVHVIWWEPGRGRNYKGAWRCEGDYDPRPTHWMSLPEAPR